MDRGTSSKNHEEYHPLAEDKPYTHFILAKSQVETPYQLKLPAKMRRVLPSCKVPAVLECGKKKWNMYHLGNTMGEHSYFDSFGWKSFVVDNKLKVGDGCVFELTECSTKGIRFRVQILSGDLPAELLERTKADDGSSSDKAIMIE